MIRLRQQIESGLRHPVVGPLLVLLLAVLVVFVAFHETNEGIAGHAELICVALAIVLIAALPVAGMLRPTIQPRRAAASRAPPHASPRLPEPGAESFAFHPLRL